MKTFRWPNYFFSRIGWSQYLRGYPNTSTTLLPIGLISIRNISKLFLSMNYKSMRHTSTRLCSSVEHKKYLFCAAGQWVHTSTQKYRAIKEKNMRHTTVVL
jgi:hypothetical protein